MYLRLGMTELSRMSIGKGQERWECDSGIHIKREGMRGRRKITFEGLEFEVSTEYPNGIPWGLCGTGVRGFRSMPLEKKNGGRWH